MRETKHTPGPWTARQNAFWRWEIHYDGGQLASLSMVDDPASPPPREEIEANAHLLEAAPDLLEACKLAARYWDGEYNHDQSHVTRALSAAIAKAEGGRA
jgi:hypothetical protein